MNTESCITILSDLGLWFLEFLVCVFRNEVKFEVSEAEAELIWSLIGCEVESSLSKAKGLSS